MVFQKKFTLLKSNEQNYTSRDPNEMLQGLKRGIIHFSSIKTFRNTVEIEFVYFTILCSNFEISYKNEKLEKLKFLQLASELPTATHAHPPGLKRHSRREIFQFFFQFFEILKFQKQKKIDKFPS